MIKSSLDWAKEKDNLRVKLKDIRNHRDILKMIDNMQPEVDRLSKEEVNYRRTGKKDKVNELCTIINGHINEIEDFILIAKLVG